MLKTTISDIPMFVSIFWFVLLLIDYKKKNLSKLLLLFAMLDSAFLYFCHALYFNHEYGLYIFWENIYIFCSLAVYPLFYLYIKSLSRTEYFKLRDYWVLFPALVTMFISFLLYFNLSPDEKSIYAHKVLYGNHSLNISGFSTILKLEIVKLHLVKILFIIQMVPILYFGIKYMISYNNKINNYYSDNEGKTLKPFVNLLIIFTVGTLFSTIADFIGKSYFIDSISLMFFPAVIFGLLIFIIGYIGYKQDFSMSTFIKEQKNDETSLKCQSIENDTYDDIKISLVIGIKKLLEIDEIYKKHDLRIVDISKKLNTNRTYISKVVNDDFHTNFNDLINAYRIECAKKLLIQNNKDSLNIIAERSGFKSDSSFYRIFKEKVGISPGNYRKRIVKVLEKEL